MFFVSIITWIATPFCILSIYLIHKFKRRPLMLLLVSLCTLEWILLTIAQLKSLPFVGFTGLFFTVNVALILFFRHAVWSFEL